MLFSKPEGDDQQLEILAGALKNGIIHMLKERADALLPVRATMEKKQIIEFMKKMRVDSIDKFPSATFVSTVNYYANEHDMAKKKTLGALVIYVEEEYVPELLRLLKYPVVNYESEDALKDACGTLANILAGRFKNEMLTLGLSDLEMTHFTNYRNNALVGVDFYPKQLNKYEINIYIRDNKRLVVELTMGPVVKKK